MSYLHFNVVVWGMTHTKVFIDIGLPSLLAPGNLPGAVTLCRSRFRLYTRLDDLKLMCAAPAFQRLLAMLPVDIILIDNWFDSAADNAPHALMSRAHREVLQHAHTQQADTVFLPPDCVWADGSLTNLERIAARGARIVHVAGLRLILEEMVPTLVDQWRTPDGCVLPIPPLDLTRLALSHLHPISQASFFCEYGTRMMPANLLWKVGDEGILARCFHLHPLLVKPNEFSATFRKTIDDDLSIVLGEDGSRDVVVNDSNDVLVFELSSRSHRVQADYLKGSISEIAAWAEVGANARHRELVRTPIRLHTGTMTPEQWQLVEAEADYVVSAALALLDQSTKGLLGRHDNIVNHRALAAQYCGVTIESWAAAEGLRVEELPPLAKMWAFQASGLARRAEGELQAAVIDYGKAIRATQEISGMDPRGTVVQYDQRGADGPAMAALHYLRGTARAELGDLKGALADFELGLEFDPENVTLEFLRHEIKTRLQPLPNTLLTSRSRIKETFRIFAAGQAHEIRPWHWGWPYLQEIIRPLVEFLAGASVRTLLVDNESLPLSGLLTNNPNLTVWQTGELQAIMHPVIIGATRRAQIGVGRLCRRRARER